jgi:hypothetical protein
VKAPYVINWSTAFGWRFKSLYGNENEHGSQFDHDRGMKLFGWGLAPSCSSLPAPTRRRAIEFFAED